MVEKRMLIVDADTARKIDDNRGDMSYSEFLEFLINNQLKEPAGHNNYVDKDEFHQFAAGMKELLRNFLEAADGAGVEGQAHTIKGAAASVGGEGLRAVAQQIEEAVRQGDWPAVYSSFVQLEEQFARLQRAMAP